MQDLPTIVGGAFELDERVRERDTFLSSLEILQLGLSCYIIVHSGEKIIKTVSGTGLLDRVKVK